MKKKSRIPKKILSFITDFIIIITTIFISSVSVYTSDLIM